jgi:HNH endonuclease
VTPALRRAVLLRDQHRCCVPGCRNAIFLDLHHLQPRSQGGGNDAENLVGICCAHHRAVHRGDLVIERDEHGLGFRHADGRPYGELRAPAPLDLERIDMERIDMERKVSSGLRNLGFREADVRVVLSELREKAPLVRAAEPLLREALLRLGPASQRR